MARYVQVLLEFEDDDPEYAEEVVMVLEQMIAGGQLLELHLGEVPPVAYDRITLLDELNEVVPTYVRSAELLAQPVPGP